jgi:hypothetical protein
MSILFSMVEVYITIIVCSMPSFSKFMNDLRGPKAAATYRPTVAETRTRR